MVVEKGVQLPEKVRGKWDEIFTEMQPGDSVLFDSEKEAEKARAAGKYRKYRMAIRKVKGGFRVWRIA